MPICASASQLTGPAAQPGLTLYIDPANQGGNLSTCAYVVQSGTEYSNWHQLGDISVDNAKDISLAIGLLWAIAWGIKTIGRSISMKEGSDHE